MTDASLAWISNSGTRPTSAGSNSPVRLDVAIAIAPIASPGGATESSALLGRYLKRTMYEQQDVETLERQFNAAMEEADTGAALDAVRRIYDEFDRGGETLAALLHPDFQIRMEAVFLDDKVYKGMRGFEKWQEDMEELFESNAFRPEGLRSAADGRWLVLGRLQITKKEEGGELDVPLAHVLEQRDRKVASFTVYSDISAALVSVGLPA